jgi:hypothetical protein
MWIVWHTPLCDEPDFNRLSSFYSRVGSNSISGEEPCS